VNRTFSIIHRPRKKTFTIPFWNPRQFNFDRSFSRPLFLSQEQRGKNDLCQQVTHPRVMDNGAEKSYQHLRCRDTVQGEKRISIESKMMKGEEFAASGVNLNRKDVSLPREIGGVEGTGRGEGTLVAKTQDHIEGSR